MTTATASTPTSSKITFRVAVAIVITLLAWASAFVVIRGVAPHFSGGALALGRLIVGTILLSSLVIGRKWMRPSAREWVQIAAVGLAWFAAYNVALNTAEHTLDAGTTAMLVNIGPILIALGAGIFLGDGIPKWLAIGAGVAFVGVVLIGVSSGALGIGDGTGVFWCLVAAVTYAIGVLCQKPALRRVPARQVTFLGCAIGVVACLPFSAQLIQQLGEAPAAAVAGVVYLGAVPTALAFSTWAYALSKMTAGSLAVTTYLVPALVIIMGFVFYREIPMPLAIVGGVICLVGVGISRRRSAV